MVRQLVSITEVFKCVRKLLALGPVRKLYDFLLNHECIYMKCILSRLWVPSVSWLTENCYFQYIYIHTHFKNGIQLKWLKKLCSGRSLCIACYFQLLFSTSHSLCS